MVDSLLVSNEKVNLLDNINELFGLPVNISLEVLKTFDHVFELAVTTRLVVLSPVQHPESLLKFFLHHLFVGTLFEFLISVKRDEIFKFGPLPLLMNFINDAHDRVLEAVLTV